MEHHPAPKNWALFAQKPIGQIPPSGTAEMLRKVHVLIPRFSANPHALHVG